MSGKVVERALVQGSVIFSVSCDDLMGLVPPEVASDDQKLEEWLEDKAFKMIDTADTSVTIDNDVRVSLSEATADVWTNEIITDSQWSKFLQESKQNKGEG